MKVLIASFISVFIFFSAMAAKTPTPNTQKNEDISFEVPQGELVLPKVEPQEVIAPHYIGFEVSSWEPDQLNQESRLPMTTEFEKSETPKISFVSISAGSETSVGRFSTKLGLSYLRMHREGHLAIESIGYTVGQNINLYQAVVGTEWKTNTAFFSVLTPYIDVALTPTWIQSQKSEFNGGVSEVRWPIMASAGATVGLKTVGRWLGVDELALNLAVEKTQHITGSALNGTGIALGTRIGWN